VTLFDVVRSVPASDGAAAMPAEVAQHGEFFTSRWVVELMLDLVGYTPDRDLGAVRLLDPACGTGAFLEVAAERLSASCREQGRALSDAAGTVRGLDLIQRNVMASQDSLTRALLAEGWSAEEIEPFVAASVQQGDYLLSDIREGSVDLVVGNPPYIRLEDVPNARMRAYRAACSTMIGRADIYIGFYEVGLRSLKPGGALAFICADRWMRNQYGRELRRLVSSGYAVEAAITMHDVDAFEEQVSAYPAITVLRRGRQRRAMVADATRIFDRDAAGELLAWTVDGSSDRIARPAFRAARLPRWFKGPDSWPTGSPDRLSMIEDLNKRFRPLQDPASRTRVGIGVATGADGVFVTTDSTAVEPDRLLPLSMARDTVSGQLRWSGHYLVNPWGNTGSLVDLDDFPQLREYLSRHRHTLAARHVAERRPWYQTIDRVDSSLTARPKLLFPDLKLMIHPILDNGGLYPHHNLYYVVSEGWDMRVLGGLLLSGIAEAFVEAYAVKMRGGTLRFQAQYLRRIRVPDPARMSDGDCLALVEAFEHRDRAAATDTALRVYGLNELPP